MNKHDILAFGHRGASLEELVIFAAQLNVIVESFGGLEIKLPEWLAQRATEIRFELTDRMLAARKM